MNIVLQLYLIQNPDRPEFGQKPARILNGRILSFGNPPLKSKLCAKTQKPDCLRAKTIPEFDYSPSITMSYAKTQKPDLPPLKGKVSSPLKAGETLPSPGLELGCEVGVHKRTLQHIHPTTVASTAKHQSHRRLPPRAANQIGDHSWLIRL